jgi:heme A synthase
MKQVHLVAAIVVIAVSGVAGVWGAWCWWRMRTSPWFWRLLRTSQALIVVQIAIGGLVVLVGHKPPQLHLIYGVLPLLVSFIAEQLRVSSTQMVLDARGFESAQAVGNLPADEQQDVVLAIVRREIGVMALAALVNFVLLGRAAMTG